MLWNVFWCRVRASYTWLGASEMYRIIYYNILYAVLMLAVPLVALSGLNVRLIRALTALRRKVLVFILLAMCGSFHSFVGEAATGEVKAKWEN